MKKLLAVVMILGVASMGFAANEIHFPVGTMGQGATQSFAVGGDLDTASALGVQVIIVGLFPVGPTTGTLTLAGSTTVGGSFEVAEGANWLDYSDATIVMGMTLNWALAAVSGSHTPGFVSVTSSGDAEGTWELRVSDSEADGFLDELGGTFGDVFNGEITVSSGPEIPEPATMALVALGILGAIRRKRA